MPSVVHTYDMHTYDMHTYDIHTYDNVTLHHTCTGTAQSPPPPYTRGDGTTSVVMDMTA